MPGGNHKMFPRVSPKKSWEGLFGGVAFTIGAAFILNRYGWFDTITKEGYELLITGAFALIVSGFGTLGDLMESLFKRSLGVKDSGKFLPGHGGVLDRFDSILLAAPMALLFVVMMILC
jgi:phosphatidate cytidylyltransferase